jgi:NAD(P)-dependent dehydrogenase (short-subunit alcohol dehydrogenase family)
MGAHPGSAVLKLLLDEIYPPAIAEQLCARGHDVVAVTACAELRSLPDESIFATAQQERRAVVTENIGDFSSIADAADQRRQAHHGLVLIDPAKYPRGNPRTIGRMVTELDRLLSEHRGDGPTSLRWWL